MDSATLTAITSAAVVVIGYLVQYLSNRDRRRAAELDRARDTQERLILGLGYIFDLRAQLSRNGVRPVDAPEGLYPPEKKSATGEGKELTS